MKKTCEFQPPDPAHHVHFILAGYDSEDSRDPYKLYFLWTKRKLPQLDGDEISTAFTVPRMMRMEVTLNRMAGEGAEIDSLLKVIRAGMISQAESNEEVGGPFLYAAITEAGVQISEG